MNLFAGLMDRLLHVSDRDTRVALLADYFRQAPDPDRGIALGLLTGELKLAKIRPVALRGMIGTRVDAVLFKMSHEFVGELAETVALTWPGRASNRAPPLLGEIRCELAAATRDDIPDLLEAWLDTLDGTGRWALLKLVTGGARAGVPPRLAKASLATMGGVDLGEIEEVWHGMEPPYSTLFAWLEGREDRPSLDGRAVFRPLMLATELAAEDLERLDSDAYVAEWKWDGLRVQLASVSGERRLYSRAGDDISGAFPEIIEAMTFDGVRDGELLVMRNGEVAPFGDLEKRLGRATVSARSLSELPAHVRLYDVLFDGEDDLRELSFEDRRRRLEALVERENPARMDLSDLIPFQSIGDLDALRAACRDRGVEGLMLKRRDSAYVAGRPSGPWIKWKCEPLTVDAVLMYALRGSGGASAGNAAFTLGVWRGEELVPAGKVSIGFTDEERARLDEWVRDHTLKRHGPVREVEQSLVIEFAFDSVRRSSRHKSGIVTRGQRAHRIRWDKPAAEADRLDALERWAG